MLVGREKLTGLPVMESPRAMIRTGVLLDCAEVSDTTEARRARKNGEGSMLVIGLRIHRFVGLKVVFEIPPSLRVDLM